MLQELCTEPPRSGPAGTERALQSWGEREGLGTPPGEVMFARGGKTAEAPGRARGRRGGEGSGFSTARRRCRRKAKSLMNKLAALRGSPPGALGTRWTHFNHQRGPGRQWGGRCVHLTRCPVPRRHRKGCGEVFRGSPPGLDSGYPTFSAPGGTLGLVSPLFTHNRPHP